MALVLFGARSPLVVEYEETAARNEISPLWIVHVGQGAPRALNRKAIVRVEDMTPEMVGAGFVACAFNPARRSVLAALAVSKGLRPAPALIDPTAIVAGSSRVGAGSFLNAGAIVGAASRIGAHVLVNRASSIGHHCLVDDLVSIGPGVHLASNMRIGSGAIMGTGAVILPDVSVGADAIVAAGSVVRSNVEDGSFVAGAPASPRAYDRAAGIFGDTDAE